MTRARRIWIGRNARGAAPWAAAARAAGWAAEALPLVTPLPVAPQGPDPAGARAGDVLALTSSAAVEHGLPHFAARTRAALRYAVVGPATRAALRAAQPEAQIVVDAEGAGSSVLAEGLLAAIEERASDSLQVWWPCAAEPRREMERAFGAAGVPLRMLVCYRTEAADGPLPPSGEAVLVFSPSGLASLAARVTGATWPPLLAVGATTAAAMEERGLRPRVVLDRVDPEALAAALRALDPTSATSPATPATPTSPTDSRTPTDPSP